MQRDLSTHSTRRVVLAVLLGATLVLGSAALAVTVTDLLRARISGATVTKVATGSDLYRKQLIVKGKVLDGPLLPGVKRPLKVTMKNPLSQPLKVTDVTVTVKKPAAAGCQKSWVKASSFHAGKKTKPITVKANKKAKVVLTVQLKNLSTVNQDACKNTSIPMKIETTAKPG